jgi:hypothetical protein
LNQGPFRWVGHFVPLKPKILIKKRATLEG